ncbi:MAG TPA: glycosyltransferase, partial [Thermoleophilaceae bacterium]|nr:glycosyltransferase [Thermoleophilaceae bacterium]
PLPPERFGDVLTAEQTEAFERAIAVAGEMLTGRVVWNVNSTATGGGVAEMLRSLIPYARGGGVDARWVVIDGTSDFFRVTKRIHNRLHGWPGDGGDLGDEEREIYEAASAANAAELTELVAPGDVVILHDPQTAGLAATVRDAGAHVIWRCHVGIDQPNGLTRSAWEFLRPYVTPAERYVFSRQAFAWDGLDIERIALIPPSIDAFSPKNQRLDPRAVDAILQVAGLAPGDDHTAACYTRQDGSPARVDRSAQRWEAAVIPADVPLIVQVSRWDRLKDPEGVIEGFARGIAHRTLAHMLLAGPDVTAVADDPEGLEVLNECIDHRRSLPTPIQERVHLAALPMDDAEENATIVNAIQRRATVAVQKSLAEGFGLTVAEAMWKARPVVASRIGGIQDQIVDGESGVLVDPRDLDQYGTAVVALLEDPAHADLMGQAAHVRVRDAFLGSRHLSQYLDLLTDLIHGPRAPVAGLAQPLN